MPKVPAPDVPVNRYVRLTDGRVGFTKYFGYIEGKRKRFVGIELIDSEGKHDGIVKGLRYFKCKPGRGIMISPKKVERVFPARTKKRHVREECRMEAIHSRFPAVGYYANKIKTVTRILVNIEANLSGIFSHEVLQLIFEYTDFLHRVDTSEYSGEFHYRVQRAGGAENKRWEIDMILSKNGVYKISGISAVGYIAEPDYYETGSFDVANGILNLKSHDAKGDSIGAIFHGSCHQRGSKVKRSMKFKDVKRFVNMKKQG